VGVVVESVAHFAQLILRKRPAKDRKRVEKTVYVETKTIRTPDGDQQVRSISQGGRIGLGEVTESGKPVFVPLDRVRTHRNTDKRGTFRWYNDYRLPEHLGVGVVTVGLGSLSLWHLPDLAQAAMHATTPRPATAPISTFLFISGSLLWFDRMGGRALRGVGCDQRFGHRAVK
jgi:hypothetical protein